MIIPSPRVQRKARIEIIPLIDIIFFLLATFVMVSLSMIKNHGIPVNLPIAATGTAQEREDSISIGIQADGQYFYNKEPVTVEELNARLAALKQTTPEARLFINADAKVEFGQAVAVLDEARKLGLTKVAIETVPR